MPKKSKPRKKDGKECSPSRLRPGRRSVEVVIHTMSDDGPIFLVLRRIRSKGGFWQPVTGTVEDGEALKEAALREVAEETGIKASPKALVDMGYDFVFYHSGNKWRERLFALKVPSVEVTIGPEHDDVKWLGYLDARVMMPWLENRRALDRTMARIMGRRKEGWRVPEGPPSPWTEGGSGWALLLDFDGTVTLRDASVQILERYTGDEWKKWDVLLHGGKIGLQDCIGEQFTIVKASREEMVAFVRKEVRPRAGLRDLVDWCRGAGSVDVVITSGGLDYYIEAFLDEHGLGDVPFRADHAMFFPEVGMVVESGYPSKDCDNCGNCKRQLVEEARAAGKKVAYVGDGIADRCPARAADVVFARAGLLEWCKKEGIECIPFDDLNDVRRALSDLVRRSITKVRARRR